MRLIALALLGGALCTACGGDPGRIEVGRAVPDYATTTLAGDSVTLQSLRGQVVLLNVWATWCHPCRTEIPELLTIYEKYKSRGFTLVGVTIDVDGAEDAIRSFMDEFRMTFPVWHDREESVLTRFRAIGVPSTFLIDKDGILRWRKLGPVTPGDSSLVRILDEITAPG